MVLPYINIDSSTICPGAYRYFNTDQSGTGTRLVLVFDTHPETPLNPNTFLFSLQSKASNPQMIVKAKKRLIAYPSSCVVDRLTDCLGCNFKPQNFILRLNLYIKWKYFGYYVSFYNLFKFPLQCIHFTRLSKYYILYLTAALFFVFDSK